jgi:hypothetical protein
VGADEDFIGNLFRVEMPLRVQHYRPDPRDITRWFLVMPPEGRTDVLGAARRQAAPTIARWEAEAQRAFNDMSSTSGWLGSRSSSEQAGAALVVLSHHESDRLFFDTRDQVSADNIVRRFERPAVAILDGCGTGATAGALIQNLNEVGFDAIVATATPVGPQMAGDFLTCLSESLDRNPNDPAFTLASAFSDAVSCLREQKQQRSRALTWMLLGNGNMRLRSPRR